VLERRGEEVHTRHILMKINPGTAALERTKNKLDSIYKLVVDKKWISITLLQIIRMQKKANSMGYDPKSRRLKPHNRNSYGWLGKISIYSNRSPKPGEYSKPEQFTDKMGDVGYRFNYLKTRIRRTKQIWTRISPKSKRLPDKIKSIAI
jgi:peptidyl-prolyl cis-trans isomerase SurA